MSLLKSVFTVVGKVPGISQCIRKGLDLQTLAGSCRGSRLNSTYQKGLSLQSSRSYSYLRQSNRSILSPSYGSIVAQRFVQTKSDVEMSEFLKEEIQAEKESLKATGKAVQVKGFDVTTNEAEVTLKKTFQGEQITILINVNHAVDTDEGTEDLRERPEDTPDMTKMVCRPNFSVEILKGQQTLAFNCSLVRSDDEDADEMPRTTEDGQTYQDLFNIDEFSIYKGEFKDSTYLIAGEVMDGNFYDNLMNMLDERGINSDFVKEVTDFCTLYEQKLYVNLLEHLQEIVKSK